MSELRISSRCESSICIAGLLCLTTVSSLFSQNPLPPIPTPEPGSQRGATELTRGPVHEAFAQPYEMKSGGEFIVKQTPPQPIDEIPPSELPDDPGIQWIPGYWGWEPDEERFVWISGLWRRAPEGTVWNPGYWVETDGGYTWVSGAWVREGEAFLLSQTPPEQRVETVGNAPSSQHFWIPGQWRFERGGFIWRPGFWSRAYAGRVWVPFHYSWTPQGYLAVNGYWDYDLEHRGVLYCPVAFDHIPQPTYRYVPSVVTRVDYLPTHLFVYRSYRHYCFGDYYNYSRPGLFVSWTSRSYRHYDPLRFFFLTFHRDRFDHHCRRHDWYQDHRDHRPRHTWRDQRDFRGRRENFDLSDALLTQRAKDWRSDNDNRQLVRFSTDRDRWNKIVLQNVQDRKLKRDYEERLKKLKKTKSSSKLISSDDRDRIGPLQIRAKRDDDDRKPMYRGLGERQNDRFGQSSDRFQSTQRDEDARNRDDGRQRIMIKPGSSRESVSAAQKNDDKKLLEEQRKAILKRIEEARERRSTITISPNPSTSTKQPLNRFDGLQKPLESQEKPSIRRSTSSSSNKRDFNRSSSGDSNPSLRQRIDESRNSTSSKSTTVDQRKPSRSNSNKSNATGSGSSRSKSKQPFSLRTRLREQNSKSPSKADTTNRSTSKSTSSSKTSSVKSSSSKPSQSKSSRAGSSGSKSVSRRPTKSPRSGKKKD